MAEEKTEGGALDAAAAAAAEAPAAPQAPAAAPAPPAEVLAPKERRRRARTTKAAKVKSRKQMTPEERHAERIALRGKKAQLRRTGRAKAKAKAPRTDVEPTPAREHAPANTKLRQGVVVSDKADKTITVRIDTSRRHRRYAKIVRTSQTLHAHDESNDAHIGDTVMVREARPLSRLKRWRLVEVVERAK
jgi:small subunit ribosomal protein S17